MLHLLRGLFWVCCYVLVAVAPLLVARLAPSGEGQGFVIDMSVALGFAALTIMVLQFGLVARFQRVSAPFGMDALLQYHRQIGFVALVFALVHPAMLFLDDPSKLQLLNFPHAPMRARFASISVVALMLLIATSVWRKQLRLRYEVWQALHGLLSVAVVALALAHAAGVGYYAASVWQCTLWAVIAAAVIVDLLWIRIIKPLGLYRRPWKVQQVKAERGGAWTVSLVPEGDHRMRFVPGQFGWVLIDQSPLSISQHPFSFSSSAEHDDRVSVTIKARGDFTRGIKNVQPGSRAYVDGPYGLFSTDHNEGFGFVFIGGGVGITPLMSMLRTMADRGDMRPCLLFYGSKDLDGITFYDDLKELEGRLNLTVVHALESAPSAWEGESGFIDAAMLRRHLPQRHERFRYFVCGPTPMMDAMEKCVAEIGVADEHVHTERFDMV